MKKFLIKFRWSEKGAVTVDWVVIVAGVISLGVSAMMLIETEVESKAKATGEFISDRAK